MSIKTIKTLSSREVYRNRWMRVREDAIERSNGAPGIYGVVDKDPCALVIPLEECGGDRLRDRLQDRLHLVQQFRYPVQENCLEFPQGGWEEADVDMEELARGELREETGFTAETMIYLGPMQVAYGFANQLQHVFLAMGLTPGATDFDAEEHDLTLHTLTVAEFEQAIVERRIKDCSTLAAWGLYRLWAERRGDR